MSNESNSFDDQINSFVSLISNRQNSADEVSRALSQIVQKNDMEIEMDETDYDAIEDKPTDSTNENDVKKVEENTNIIEKEGAVESSQNDEEPSGNEDVSSSIENKWKEGEYDDIPMGLMGAKMMVTFGDGQHPDVDAVDEALKGVRQCLQAAVKDARALRRRQTTELIHAKAKYNCQGANGASDSAKYVKKNVSKRWKSGTKALNIESDADISFRALLLSNEDLSKDFKCGFDMSQLALLFPEEMNEYNDFMKVKNKFAKGDDETSGKRGSKSDSKNPSDEDDGVDEDEDANFKEAKIVDGETYSRKRKFDLRTIKMKDDFYLSFAEVRKGSFLACVGELENTLWNRTVRNRGRGRKKQGSWDLPASCVRFLHWIGFDPMSGLPPPNVELAHALGFLGYNFMGKVVEKAIFLRCLKERKLRGKSLDENFAIEMDENSQLNAEDIKCSLQDTTKLSIYSSLRNRENQNDSSNFGSASSIYFGPGYEGRLELELETLYKGGQNTDYWVDEEELKKRKDDDDLFSKISVPYKKIDGVFDILDKATKKQLNVPSQTELERMRINTKFNKKEKRRRAENPPKKRKAA